MWATDGPADYLEALMLYVYNNEFYHGGFFTACHSSDSPDAQDLVLCGSA